MNFEIDLQKYFIIFEIFFKQQLHVFCTSCLGLVGWLNKMGLIILYKMCDNYENSDEFGEIAWLQLGSVLPTHTGILCGGFLAANSLEITWLTCGIAW